jgi:hypothetical protein
MTLGRTGSRVIVVAGERFRWVVTGRREPAPGFVVELADTPASRLIATATPYAVVTPGLVAQGIRLGREAGWDPYRTGADLQLAEPVWAAPSRIP